MDEIEIEEMDIEEMDIEEDWAYTTQSESTSYVDIEEFLREF